MAIWRCEIYSRRRRRGTWSLKRHKLALTYTSPHTHTHTEAHINILMHSNLYMCTHVHTHTPARRLYLIFPALNNITVQERIKFIHSPDYQANSYLPHLI